MRGIVLLVMMIVGQMYAQNNYSALLKQYYSVKSYDECFDLGSQASRDLKGKDKAEAYYYLSLCYWEFSKDNLKQEEYPNALRKSAKFLAKGIKKDNGLEYYKSNKQDLDVLRGLLELKSQELYRLDRPMIATYIEKTLEYGYRDFDEGKNTRSDNKEDKKEKIQPSSDVKKDSTSTKRNISDQLVVYAKTKIGIPYKYGGMSDAGFDCSGYTSTVYDKIGVKLPRRSVDQAEVGYKVKLKEAKKGDLIFFEKNGNINHVGIVINEEGEKLTMIHASTSKGIRIDHPLSDPYWKGKIRMIKRVM